MNQNPVKTIKDEEAKAQKEIEKLSQDNARDLDEKRISKEKELESHKEGLREKGKASLDSAKQEGMTKFKQISDEEESKKGSIISKANSNKDEAIKKVVSYFEKHLVTN